MKAILTIPDKDINFELNNFSISQFTMVGERLHKDFFVEKFPIGKPIFMLTSNMPLDLKEQIESIISNYCNH